MPETQSKAPNTSTAVILENVPTKDQAFRVKVVNLPQPVPKAGEALVKIDAVSLNHRELYVLKNQFPGVVLDSPLGSDAVGHVVQLNGESSTLKVGDRVVVMPSDGWISNSRGPEDETKHFIRGSTKSPGVFVQYFATEQANLFKAPAYLTDIEAAALPLAGLTAYRAVFTKGQVSKDQNVLITGIGGGVALYMLQYAVAVGANVYVTSSDESKIERAIKLGAKGGVNYRQENWDEQLIKLANGQQFDVAIDSANGPGAVTILNKVLAPGGIMVTFGQTVGPFTVDMSSIMRNIEIRGSTMGSRVEFEEMLKFVESHQIRPVVSDVWEGLEKTKEAIQHLKEGGQFGKLVLTVTTK
ncbi:zinc-binding dehydrogenase [Mortierella sp. GBAus27b]|nr:hypothetical protein BGX31_005766 [Mortierella sp. GBA43]KAI8358065.1 zinc-binding dehydrogenase [Mortierella sp. GBAus27b]